MRCVKRWVCSILSLVMVSSWLRESRLEENQGRGESLIWARILECLTSPMIKPGEVDKFVDEEEELGVRRKEQRLFGS